MVTGNAGIGIKVKFACWNVIKVTGRYRIKKFKVLNLMVHGLIFQVIWTSDGCVQGRKF